MSTTFTALLPADISLPEDTWLHARVRRHGRDLEVTAEQPADAPSASTTPAPFDAWLAKAAGSAKAGLTTNDLMAMTRGED